MARIKQFALRKKNLVYRLLAIMLVVFGSVGMLSRAAFAQTTYIINDGGRLTYHTSYTTDPVAVLDEAGLELGKDDTYTTQESFGVSEIMVNRQQFITIDNGGQMLTVGSQGETVEQLLTRLNIAVDAQTTVSQKLSDKTEDGMQIVISRTTYVTETYTQTVPYQVKEVNDDSLSYGERRVITAGSDGEMLCTAQVTYVNGVETERSVVSSEVTTAPVDEIVAVGTAVQKRTVNELTISDGIITLPSGDILTYTGSMQGFATAYNWQDTNSTITATGTTVQAGTVAVDPSVIPYGTRMFIITNDGQYVYGEGTAEDCGGYINGTHIDLYFETVAECIAFGVRDCTIYFLG